MIISVDIDKAYDKPQHPFMIKDTQPTSTRWELCQPDRKHL